MRRLRLLAAISTALLAVVVLTAVAAQAASPFGGAHESAPTALHLHLPWAQPLFQAQAALSMRFNGALTDLRDARDPAAVIAALAIAFLYGCLHAAGPGHGKALVSGYLISRNASVRDIVRLGTQIAVMHVGSAVVLVAVIAVFVRSAFSSPEDLRGVQLASDVAIVAIGAFLFVRAFRARRDHAHAPSCSCAAHAATSRTAWLTALGAGLVPCSGTMITLVFALGNGILVAGIGMLFAIAVGMSVTLVLIGSLAVASRRATTAGGRIAGRPRVRRVLDLGGPSFIMLAGGMLLLVTLAAA